MSSTSGETRPHIQAALGSCKSVMSESGIDTERVFSDGVSKGLLLRRGRGYVAVDEILWLPHTWCLNGPLLLNETVTILIKWLLH